MRQRETLDKLVVIRRRNRHAGKANPLQFCLTDQKPAGPLQKISGDPFEILNEAETARLSPTGDRRDEIRRLRAVFAHWSEVQERERRKISREIHDEIGSMLSGIKFKIENAILQMEQQKASPDLLKDLIPVIQTTVEASRRIIGELRPSILDDLGLLAAVHWHCREFESTHHPIRLEYEIDLSETDVPAYLKTPIYRIVQEGLNSFARHGKGQQIHLFLQKMDGRIELAIHDNGGESNSKEIPSLKGHQELDYDTLSERTELSGGRFIVESSQGKPMGIRASWPIRVNP